MLGILIGTTVTLVFGVWQLTILLSHVTKKKNPYIIDESSLRKQYKYDVKKAKKQNLINPTNKVKRGKY